MIHTLSKEKLIRYSCLLIASLIIAYRYLSLNSVTVNCVIKDQWRFLKLIEYYYEGSLTLMSFVEVTNQLNFGYSLLFLVNALVFNLNMTFELYYSIMVMSICLYVLYVELIRSGIHENNTLLIFAFSLLSVVLFSESKHALFRFTLISVLSSSNLLILLTIGVIVENYRNQTKLSYSSLVAIVFLLFLMVFGFGGGRSPAALVAVMIMLLITHVLLPYQRMRLKEAGVIFLGASIVFQSLYIMIDNKITDGMVLGLISSFHNFSDAMIYFLRALAASVTHALVLSGLNLNAQLLIGAFVLLLNIIAIYLYFQLKIYKHTIIPMILIIYSILFICLLVIGRFGIGYENATAPRYSAETMVGMIGVFWIFSVSIIRVPYNWLKIILTAVIFFIVVFVETQNELASIRHDNSLKWQLEQQVTYLHEMKYDQLSNWFVTARGLEPVIEGDQIMRRYKLGPYAVD